MSGGMLTYESAVSVFDGSPFVVLRWANECGQLTPEETRQQGLGLIAAADAAEHDALVFECLSRKGLDLEVAAAFLQQLRALRQAKEES